ncbi:uncharacterized protein [Antedon mediterranea]|uniref:uncharacterized protein n=1 Tax=Antedon mediterranea TaxID=105859 RepID=UPI003AF9FE9D
MDHTLGFYDENDFCQKLQFSTEEEYFDGFGGLNGVEDSIDLSAFLSQSQNEPINSVSNTGNTGGQEGFPTLGNLDHLFGAQPQIQNNYSLLPAVKQEPAEINYGECESTVTSPTIQSDMPQQTFFTNTLPQPSTGMMPMANDTTQSPYSTPVSSPTSTTMSYKSSPASKSLNKSSSGKRQRPVPEKGTQEYVAKRQKNNVAVRKSREKSKAKAMQLQDTVSQLTDENDRLNKKVELLTKELSVLKQLFTNVGKHVPQELQNC